MKIVRRGNAKVKNDVLISTSHNQSIKLLPVSLKQEKHPGDAHHFNTYCNSTVRYFSISWTKNSQTETFVDSYNNYTS